LTLPVLRATDWVNAGSIAVDAFPRLRHLQKIQTPPKSIKASMDEDSAITAMVLELIFCVLLLGTFALRGYW